jgi:hypothetical protein
MPLSKGNAASRSLVAAVARDPPIGATIVSRELVSCGMQIRSIWRCLER